MQTHYNNGVTHLQNFLGLINDATSKTVRNKNKQMQFCKQHTIGNIIVQLYRNYSCQNLLSL